MTPQAFTSSEGLGEPFSRVLQRRLSRRTLLRRTAAATPLLVLGVSGLSCERQKPAPFPRGLQFQPINLSSEDTIIVPPGYSAQVLIRWGDPLYSDVPPLDIANHTPEQQARQFGYDCDFVAYFPLSKKNDRGLLAVNHEHTLGDLMFPGYDRKQPAPTRRQVDIELAALGVSVVEVERQANGEWRYIVDSRYNRRITVETEMAITGPAAGHDWMKTSYDLWGTRVRGTLNNCGGGKTPWGTYLTCEEIINDYFAHLNRLPGSDPRTAVHRRYDISREASVRRWEDFHPRFDVSREPNEPFRFGWIVEIDPFNPASLPRKRTALGRFKHECAAVAVSPDKRVVVYSGDDEAFEYIYKFISAGRFNANRREANFNLLDEGTLYVAKFSDDGSGEWLPLVFGQGPLTPQNGFRSQGDVLINARRAADHLGATKMDRPEDIERNPQNGKIYCVMTNNPWRQPHEVGKANPRANNRHGHIIELTEDGNDPAALRFRWEVFLLCGDPNAEADGAFFGGFDPKRVSPISSPDNITFDGAGNLWIATDGQPLTFKKNDGLFVVPVEGSERGFLRQFLSAPRGAEVCGPEFTPDFTTLFCAIQHPGEGSTLERPTSTWPDGTAPPRPSVIAIVKTTPGSKTIGS